MTPQAVPSRASMKWHIDNYGCFLYSMGVRPVRRRKYFAKNEGLAKCISSAICAAGLSAAGLADNSAEVTLGKAKTVGIVAYLMVLCTVLACQLDETIKDGLLART